MEKIELAYRRHVLPGDPVAVREMAESTGFFYDYEIPVAVDLVEDALKFGEESPYRFIFAEADGKTIAYTCYGHIAGTEAGYDLYWIITHNDYRGKGIGKMVLEETHNIVRELGGHFIIAETSTLEKYTPTRRFYLNFGYKLEAEIRDFYTRGDGKLMFVYRF